MTRRAGRDGADLPPPGPLRIRFSRPRDRAALGALGHSPAIAAVLSPAFSTRAAWAIGGVEARGIVAEETPGCAILGSVQFVRARRDTGTWMFGHWRVAPPRRREGIGRRLIAEGLRLLPRIRRLYSYVDWGNEISILAHRRLGFEASGPIAGRASLRALSTIGPATPPGRLRETSGEDRALLLELYRRAMGPLWFSLFPGDDRFSEALGAGPEGPPLALLGAVRAGRARTFSVQVDDRPPAALVVVRGAIEEATLYADPARCDGSLLAKVALRLLALGAPRDLEMELRGLGRALLEAPGPIAARVLMGMPDVSLLAPEAGSPS